MFRHLQRSASCMHGKHIRHCPALRCKPCIGRHFPSKEAESRSVASLVDKAMAGCSVSASASSAQQGKAQRKKGGAAASPDSAQAAPTGSASLADAASRALVALMREAESCAQMALLLIMQKARAPAKEVGYLLSEQSSQKCPDQQKVLTHAAFCARQVAVPSSCTSLMSCRSALLLLQLDRLSQQLQRLERELEAAKGAEASARAEAASEAKRRALQTAEAEAAGANARSEHAQALNSLQASVRKLEVCLRSQFLINFAPSSICTSFDLSFDACGFF